MGPSGLGIIIFILAMLGFFFNMGRTILRYWLKNQVRNVVSTVNPQEPLNEDELDQLMRWETNLITVYIIGFTALFGWVVVAVMSFLEASRWLLPILLGVFFLALGFALFLQVREKCPRCGFRIGLTSWPALPKFCMNCRVVFKKKEEI